MMMMMGGVYEELRNGDDEQVCVLHPDPVVLEINRLQNQLKEKERELGAANGEIKALRATDVLKDKAIEELRIEVDKLDKKLRVTENVVETKNLEIKKLIQEKKDAITAQYAAEATLRRVHANLKDDDSLPIESIVAPLEAEIKMYKNEIAALQEDKKAMERLTKSKETALLEAEKILRSALERALIVEEVQNQNFELRRQIEICQEENRLLEKTNRQKVLEVEKLSQTINELEEAILAGGAAANTIRDYRRRVSELQEEKRTLERELARVKVSANRVATVIANEWKDENDKVMPVRQWLEERRLLQAEMQRLKDKLAMSERTAKSEAQLKEKLKLRLKTLEEGLKNVTSFSPNPNASQKAAEKSSNNILGFLTSSGGLKKRSTSQPRGSTIFRSSPVQQANVEHGNISPIAGLKGTDSLRKKYASSELIRKGMWASRSKVADSSGKENAEVKVNTDTYIEKCNEASKENANPESEDVVSGFLYDKLQKEVISLRKLCESKENGLSSKDQQIMMLMKKVDALNKAIEVETKKAKREAAAREKEAISKPDDTRKIRSSTPSRR